ncbi:hypothetical protein [Halobaculum sp. EA56]|uniref:hypothetical protein n=1 Tax=Halobaculum sp. EA56 TaxID=3421648 RepID=UPI003EBE4B66
MSTTTRRSFRTGERAVTLLFVGLYLSTIAVPRILGSGGAVRTKLIVEALLFGAVLGGLAGISIFHGQFRFDKTYSKILMTFSALILLSAIALTIGFIRGNPTGYVLGDFYKFVVPVATVALVYAASDSSERLEVAFAIAFRVALVVFVLILGLYLTGILLPNQRPGIVYQFPVVLVLGYWLFRRGDPVARYGFPLLAVGAVPLVFYTQSLSLLLQTVLTAVLAVVYVRSSRPRDLFVVGGAVAAVGVVGGIVFLLSATQIPVEQWREYGYLGSKMVALVGDYSLYERLILLGGSRAAEPFGVLARIDDSLLQLLFGSGMGSTFVVSSPFGAPSWVGEDHFVHAGLWEAVLRTGLLGGLAYLGMLVSYLYVGWQVSHDSYLGALAAANASIILAFAPLTGKLLGSQFFSYALFAYALVRWTELRAE